MREETKKNLVEFMENRTTLDVPGNALLIYQKDQEVFRHFSENVTENTLFRVYSMTKVVTVTAAFQLFERGLYTMEDPLELYLPEFANMNVWDEELGRVRPATRKIRIRDLFSMSAGLTYPGDDCVTARELSRITKEMEEKFPGESYTTREYVRAVAKAPLAFEPGSHWRYSLCHDVLGALVEVLSGKTLGEYMKEHIFDPLHMEHTFFRYPKELEADLAELRTEDGGMKDDAKFKEGAHYESGGGGLLSTLDDYMKFATVLTRGGTSEEGVHILGRKTIDLMRSDQLNQVQKEDFNWGYLKGYSYGLGVRTYIDPAKAGVPGSVGEFGWCGVMGTWVLMDPEEQLTVVYMHQRYPNLEEYVQPHLRGMIYGDL